MSTQHRHATVDDEQSITIQDLPFQEGDTVDVFIMRRSRPESEERRTAADLRSSPLASLWGDRSDLPSSPEFARALREQAQNRYE